MNSMKRCVFIALCSAVFTGIHADVITVSDGYNVEHSIIDNSDSLTRGFFRDSYFTGGREELFWSPASGSIIFNVQSDNGADSTLLTVNVEVFGAVRATPDAFWDLIIFTGFSSYSEQTENGSASNVFFTTVHGSRYFRWNYTASILVPTAQDNCLEFWGQVDDCGPPHSQPHIGSTYFANFNMKILLSTGPIAVPEPYVCTYVFGNTIALIAFICKKKCFKKK